MLSQSSLDCLLSDIGQHQMKWRAQHSTVVNSNRLYCWGGIQVDHPRVHYNDEKRKFTSSVDIFHLPTLKWERKSTAATPPVGVMDYACTNIRENILYFGGNCLHNDCFHNDIFELNTLTNKWREIINSSPDNGPMRKRGCGMISFNMNGEDNLLVIGGFGPTTTLKWPETRNCHASTIINTISSNQQTISHLMVLGGVGDLLQILNDCWIMNLSSFIWYQVTYIT